MAETYDVQANSDLRQRIAELEAENLSLLVNKYTPRFTDDEAKRAINYAVELKKKVSELEVDNKRLKRIESAALEAQFTLGRSEHNLQGAKKRTVFKDDYAIDKANALLLTALTADEEVK